MTGVPRPKPLHDPQVLRAIAHPVRNRILAELDARGSLRAADLARELGIPANQASFHLRQLAKYGLIEEDPAAARDKRDRVWKVSNTGGFSVEMRDMEQQPGGRAASRVFRQNKRAWGHVVVDAVLSDRRAKGTQSTLTDSALMLSKKEAAELSEELDEVIQRWADHTRGGGEDRITYLYYAALLPYPAVEAE
jgi:predicted ArsR family transcriptional regulator